MKRALKASLQLVALCALPREMPTAAVAQRCCVWPRLFSSYIALVRAGRPSFGGQRKGLAYQGQEIMHPRRLLLRRQMIKNAKASFVREHSAPCTAAQSQSARLRSREPTVRLTLQALVCFAI